MSSPTVWGKYFWTTFHVAALGYPTDPSNTDIMNYKSFFENFGNIIPCKKCSHNYSKHLLELPIDKSLGSRDKLFAWTVALHNIVNKELSKSQWDTNYAMEYYLNGSYNDTSFKNEKVILRTDVWRILLIFIIILNMVVIIYILYYMKLK